MYIIYIMPFAMTFAMIKQQRTDIIFGGQLQSAKPAKNGYCKNIKKCISIIK